MSNVHIMTDSVSGISGDLAKEYGITIVPAANIIYNGKPYPDGVGITPAEAYQLAQKDLDNFSTATLSPGYLLDIYREVSKEANDIAFISFSSTASAAFKVAGMAADLMKKESPKTNIKIVDSRTYAASQGLLAIAAAKAAATGMNLDQIVSFVEQTRQKIGGIMMLDTLRYVYRTGRMSKTAARLASLFHIKPINRVNKEGGLEVVSKVRKRKDGYEKLIELIKEEAGADSLHFMVAHANSPEIAEEFIGQLRQKFNCLSVLITEYSPIMGYAAGPKCIFIGFHPELDFPK